MHFDFAFLLVLATLVTGVIWLIDRWAFAPARNARARAAREAAPTEEAREAADELGKEPVLVEYARSFFPVILAVLLLRSFLVEPFRIPSGSMMPTLLPGDFILVNKFSYGLRLPVLETELLELGSPERGDIVVFRYPKDPGENYIKRVVGLPGDRVAYYDKILYINGERQEQVPLGTYGEGETGSMAGAALRREHLDRVMHRLLLQPGERSIEGEFIVPDGHYFVMGDNRDHSNDSRYWGAVPERNLVGRAFLIWMSWDLQEGGVIWHRIGDSIQ